MTKRTLILVPLIALALVAVGCSGGQTGTGSKSGSSFASLDKDPVAEGLARGYVSTLVADYTDTPSHQFSAPKADKNAFQRNVFMTGSVQGRARAGQVGLSTTVPSRNTPIDNRFDPTKVVAKAGPNDTVVLTNGAQTATIRKVDVRGDSRTIAIGMDGMAAMSDEASFPRIVEQPGAGRAVGLMDGQAVQVKE